MVYNAVYEFYELLHLPSESVFCSIIYDEWETELLVHHI